MEEIVLPSDSLLMVEVVVDGLMISQSSIMDHLVDLVEVLLVVTYKVVILLVQILLDIILVESLKEDKDTLVDKELVELKETMQVVEEELVVQVIQDETVLVLDLVVQE
tara:strand:- start:174 stop:500 length:327 start_codon:yes stop_codon:yes gene_type:complete